MNAVATAAPFSASAMGDFSALAQLVVAIGDDEFPAVLLALLAELVGADHCCLLIDDGRGLESIASAGRAAALPQAEAQYIRRRLACPGESGPFLEQRRPRHAQAMAGRPGEILLFGRRAGQGLCLRVLCPVGAGCAIALPVGLLGGAADLIFAAATRHAELHVQKRSVAPALRSLPEIQSCIERATLLSRREAEVCARILYGMSSCGIALDLGIGKESVMTYRKRAYHRLGIGSQRELLMLFLGFWSAAGLEHRPAVLPCQA